MNEGAIGGVAEWLERIYPRSRQPWLQRNVECKMKNPGSEKIEDESSKRETSYFDATDCTGS